MKEITTLKGLPKSTFETELKVPFQIDSDSQPPFLQEPDPDTVLLRRQSKPTPEPPTKPR